jgi:hypothetical protein
VTSSIGHQSTARDLGALIGAAVRYGQWDRRIGYKAAAMRPRGSEQPARRQIPRSVITIEVLPCIPALPIAVAVIVCVPGGLR